jgi:hypothetical protein
MPPPRRHRGRIYVDATGKGNINLTGVGTYGVESNLPARIPILQTRGSGSVNVTTNFLGGTPLVATNNFTIAPETASDTVIVGGSTNYGGPGVPWLSPPICCRKLVGPTSLSAAPRIPGR